MHTATPIHLAHVSANCGGQFLLVTSVATPDDLARAGVVALSPMSPRRCLVGPDSLLDDGQLAARDTMKLTRPPSPNVAVRYSGDQRGP